MPVPSVAKRLSEFEQELDRLLQWDRYLPERKRFIARLNELRLVRATLAWEEFLEQSFLCFLRGSPTVTGRVYALKVVTPPNLGAAQRVAIGRSPYGKWLNEAWSLTRAGDLFAGVTGFAVLASPSLKEIRTIRNRIVHRSDHSRTEFRQVVLSLYGSTKPGITPGQVLTDRTAGSIRLAHYIALLRTAATVIAN